MVLLCTLHNPLAANCMRCQGSSLSRDVRGALLGRFELLWTGSNHTLGGSDRPPFLEDDPSTEHPEPLVNI